MKYYEIPHLALIEMCDLTEKAVNRAQEADHRLTICRARRTKTKRKFWLFGPIVSRVTETDEEVENRINQFRSNVHAEKRTLAYTLRAIALTSKGNISVSTEHAMSLIGEKSIFWLSEEAAWDELAKLDPAWLAKKNKEWFPEEQTTNTENEKINQPAPE